MANDIKVTRYKTKVAPRVFDDDGAECYGICDFDKKEIILADDTPSSMRVCIVIHEALHAIYPNMKHKELVPVAKSITKLLKAAQKKGYLDDKIW